MQPLINIDDYFELMDHEFMMLQYAQQKMGTE